MKVERHHWYAFIGVLLFGAGIIYGFLLIKQRNPQLFN